MTTQTKPCRIIDMINWGDKYFAKHGIDNSRHEIEWFLCQVLNCQRIDLYLQFEHSLFEKDLIKLKQMVQRRLSGEPFQHILGKENYYGRDFMVDKNVLIPRPETEMIIERLKLKGNVNTLLDIGTGSGCIAITVSLERLAENIYATDISSSAIKVAEKNMKKLKVYNVQFFIHNFLENGFKTKFDVVVSNPPYIAENCLIDLHADVRDYDPISALTDYADGLSFYRRFSLQFDKLLNPGGLLILEFGGNEQKQAVQEIFNSNNLKTNFFKDLQNTWRVVEVKK